MVTLFSKSLRRVVSVGEWRSAVLSLPGGLQDCVVSELITEKRFLAVNDEDTGNRCVISGQRIKESMY